MPLPAAVLSAGVLAAYKTLYTPQQLMQALMSTASPALKIPKIVPGGGSSYPMPMLSTSGGNVMGDALISQAQAAQNNAATITPAIPPAHLFASFELNPYESEASLKKDGAFESIGIVKMAAALDMMRKGMAACFYGHGYHEVGQVVNDQALGDSYIIVRPETEVKIEKGTPLNIMSSTDIMQAVTATAITGSPYYVNNVTEQADGTYKVTLATIAGVATTLGAAVSAGYWMFVNGGLDATGLGYVPSGLGAIIPYYANRSGGTWDTYIALPFYGVNRSAYTTRNAGGFVQKAAGESITELFIRALAKAKRARNYNPKILVNDMDYLTLLKDANSHMVSYSEVRGVKTRTNEFSMGGKVFEIVFDDVTADDVIVDSYCPQGVAWIIDADSWIMPALTDSGQAVDGIERDNKEPNSIIAGASEPGRTYSVLIDKWITTYPINTHQGPGVGVMLCNYMNFGCIAPSRNIAVVLN